MGQSQSAQGISHHHLAHSGGIDHCRNQNFWWSLLFLLINYIVIAYLSSQVSTMQSTVVLNHYLSTSHPTEVQCFVSSIQAFSVENVPGEGSKTTSPSMVNYEYSHSSRPNIFAQELLNCHS